MLHSIRPASPPLLMMILCFTPLMTANGPLAFSVRLLCLRVTLSTTVTWRSGSSDTHSWLYSPQHLKHFARIMSLIGILYLGTFLAVTPTVSTSRIYSCAVSPSFFSWLRCLLPQTPHNQSRFDAVFLYGIRACSGQRCMSQSRRPS